MAPSHDTSSTRWIETSRGIISYSALAPLIAEKVMKTQEKIESGQYHHIPLSEELVLLLYTDFCGEIVPDWTGRWRSVDMQVGEHTPPSYFLVPQNMRNYVLDLQERLKESLSIDQTLSVMAFAEGRLLSIHPFHDFNGRLNLPPVNLLPQKESEVESYLSALRAVDHHDYQLLEEVWKRRLESDFER